MFSLTSENGEGFSGTNPIILEGTTVYDLDNLFSLFYPLSMAKSDLKDLKQWISVLETAYKWNFESVITFAEKKVQEKATPIDRICLARKHTSLAGWVPQALTAISKRVEWLTQAEGERLGLADTLLVGGRMYDYRLRKARSGGNAEEE